MIYKSQELTTTQNVFSSLFASTPLPKYVNGNPKQVFEANKAYGLLSKYSRIFFPGNKTTDLIVQVKQKELQLCIRENRVDDHRAVLIYMKRCRIYRSVLRVYECTDIPLSVGISMNLRAYMLRFISSPRASDGIQ